VHATLSSPKTKDLREPTLPDGPPPPPPTDVEPEWGSGVSQSKKRKRGKKTDEDPVKNDVVVFNGPVAIAMTAVDPQENCRLLKLPVGIETFSPTNSVLFVAYEMLKMLPS
jgi:hypothetical protein